MEETNEKAWDAEMWVNNACKFAATYAIEHAIEIIGISDKPFELIAAEAARKVAEKYGVDVKSVFAKLNRDEVASIRFELPGEWRTYTVCVPGILERLEKRREKLAWRQAIKEVEECRRWPIVERENKRMRKRREAASKLIACIAAKYIKSINEKKRKALTDLMVEAAIRAMAATEAEEHGVSRKKAKQIAEEIIASRGKKE